MSQPSRLAVPARRRSSPRRRPPARILLGAAAILTAAAVILAVVLTRVTSAAPPLSPDSMAVAVTVNGQVVPVREFELFLAQERAGTFAYFQQHYADADKPGFWTTARGGQTPRQYLFRLAAADAVRATVQQALGVKYGLVPGGGYPAFLLAWKAENARRARAVAEHQPVYGPVRFTEANYFSYLSGELTADLPASLVKAGVITVTDAELHRYYLAHPGDFQQSSDLDPGTIGPVASPATAPFGQVKAEVEKEYEQQRYNAYVAGLVREAVVHADSATLAAIPVA